MYCKNCGTNIIPGSPVCSACRAPIGTGNNFCANCGNHVSPQEPNCSRCGYPNPQSGYTHQSVNVHSRIVAALLAIFLGGLGIHNFYLGYTQKGIYQVLLCTIVTPFTCGLSFVTVWVWAFVEAIMLLTGNINVDAYGVPLRD